MEGALGRGCFIPLRGWSKCGSGKRVSFRSGNRCDELGLDGPTRVPVRDKEHQTEASHYSLVQARPTVTRCGGLEENAAAKAVMHSTGERLPKLVAGNTSTNHPEP